ncbi:MAG: restriction endonuclease subunit S, partial [Pedobacter sp.]|nr:restriction endonuclease subunit S [Pedobacter sp.]
MEVTMSKNNQIPIIRFNDFNEDWERSKLGDLGQTFTGLSGKTKEDFGHGQGRFVTYMNVFSNPITNLEQLQPIEIDNSQHLVQSGDVFFTTSSETPQEVGMSSVWLGKETNVYLNSFCFGFRPVTKFDDYFLAYVLRSASFRKKMTFLAQGISRYNISKNKVMEIMVSSPSFPEQTQIGNNFKELDALIKWQEQKLEKTKKLRKVMLEKMFPKQNAGVPEIRFKGFTEKWKRKLVGEYYFFK